MKEVENTFVFAAPITPKVKSTECSSYVPDPYRNKDVKKCSVLCAKFTHLKLANLSATDALDSLFSKP